MDIPPTVRPLSILLVSYTFAPVLGGSEIEAQRVCQALIAQGHRVKVLCTGGGPMPDVARWIDPGGVPVRIFARHSHPPLRDYIFALGVAWELLRRRKRYDVVYFLMQGLHLAAGLPVARLLGKPIVMKVSGSSIVTAMLGTRMGRLELSWLRRWAYRVMVLNSGIAGEACAAGLAPSQLLWMPNPVDTADFAPCAPERRGKIRAELGAPAEAAIVLYVGRLAPEKELSSLVRAAASAARSVPGLLVVFVGDGPERAALEALAASTLPAGAYRFTGRVSLADVRRWMQAADVFTLVSSVEGFPCSLLEAMSTGLSSVVSDIPANAQLVDDGVHGLRARVGDSESISGALASLLARADLRARMGASARLRAIENYSMDRVADRYVTLFREALAASGR